MTRATPGPPGLNSRSISSAQLASELQVLREIDHVYFSSPREFDAGRHVLEQAACPADCTSIEAMFNKLKTQQQVVSGKALHLISQQRDNCDREFNEVQNIRETLNGALDTCRGARNQLGMASSRLTVSSFAILANFRKRQLVRSVLRTLELLRVLRRAEKDVAERMAVKDYEGAVLVILKCRKAASAHKEFVCIAPLLEQLQDTLEMTEEKLDSILSSICKNFNEDTFARLRRAYCLLDKLQVAMEQMLMHYNTAVNESSIEAVRPYVKDAKSDDKFQELCKRIPTSEAHVCLIDVCERLWFVMKSYYLLVKWHSKHDEEALPSSQETVCSSREFENNISKEYIRQKLRNGLLKIWNDIKERVSTFLLLTNLSEYSFEKFIQMLGVLRKLTQVAEVFCGDTSEVLQDFIKQHSINYLENYHKARMEELKLFLENEGWEMCPVRSGFTMLNLQEFKPFKRLIGGTRVTNKNRNGSQSESTSSVHSQDDNSYINKFLNSNSKETPFNMFRNESVTNEDIFGLELDDEYVSDESEEEPEELRKDYVVEDHETSHVVKHKNKFNSVIVTNTLLSVLRHCGQYLQMCRYLQPISLKVIMLMCQLYDYYFYTVHVFFTSDLEVASQSLYTPKLNSALKRIGNNIVDANSAENLNISSDEKDLKVASQTECASMAPHINLEAAETLHGLAERIVAVESVVFLARQFELMQSYLESIVSPHQRVVLEHFKDNTLAAAIDLRMPVYMCTASKALDARSVLLSMSQVKWDVRDVAAEHSPYVDLVVRQLQVFALRLERLSGIVCVNTEAKNAIWSMVAKFVVHLLVEGFSNAAKCSNGGRGLMQLDYTQLLVKLEKISGLKPIPCQDYVERYVKAYYLPRNLLEEFVHDRVEYSNKHLLALISCACDSKRDRQDLASLIENRDGVSNMPIT